MTHVHLFILQPGNWRGYGKIEISSVKEPLQFYTQWAFTALGDKILGQQTIELEGVQEHHYNLFRFSEITNTHFSVELENEKMGLIHGNGTLENERITWQFSEPIAYKDTIGFTGREEYLLLETGDYQMNAEYRTPFHQSKISGIIYKV